MLLIKSIHTKYVGFICHWLIGESAYNGKFGFPYHWGCVGMPPGLWVKRGRGEMGGRCSKAPSGPHDRASAGGPAARGRVEQANGEFGSFAVWCRLSLGAVCATGPLAFSRVV